MIAERFSPILALLRTREGMLGVVTAVALTGGALLAIADFLDLFEIQAGRLPVESQSGGDQHSYAVLLASAGVIGGVLAARATGQWPPAAAAAVLALVALAITLIGDLPEATRSDLVRGARIADADPALGFWTELVGALVALAGSVGLLRLLRYQR